VDLSGEWRARPTAAGAPGAERGDEGSLDDETGPDWCALDVPSHWGSVPDLDRTVRSVLHRHRFEYAGEGAGDESGRDDGAARSWLVLDGICYQGDVWLDGSYLGDTEGWFFPHRFEVGHLLAARADHVLDIEVTCPGPGAPDGRRALIGALQDPRFVPPDWNPGGIWRPARLVTTGPVPILHFRAVCTAATEARATVRLRAVVHAAAATTVRIRTRVGAVDHEHDQPLAAGENQLEWDVHVAAPERWWPRALGEPVLHDLTVEVLADGRVSDRRTARIGLRSVRLHDWTLWVNGERLFLKGAVLGPTRPALGRVTPAEARADVDAAVELGLDALRVHTHVARAEVYERADEVGMLLWQDMPMHGGFARGVKASAQRQARELVDLLGHHASVFLWNAHDEPHAAWLQPDSATGRLLDHQRPTWNRAVLDRGVRRAIRKADPSRPVDVHGGLLPNLPSLDGTDTHLWFGWRSGRAEDLATFVARMPRAARFVSDFGAWSVPSDPGDRSDAVDPDDLRWQLLRRVPPDAYPDEASWRAATQQVQADLLRTQIEILRRLKYRPTGGFTFSQLADGRPDLGAGLLDTRRARKTAWDAVAGACAPVLVTTTPLPTTVEPGERLRLDVHVVSDRRDPLGEVRVEARLTAGDATGRWGWTGQVPADSCVRVGTIRWTVPERPGPLRLDLRLVAGELRQERNTCATILPGPGRGV
jgi:beta-mannosidase